MPFSRVYLEITNCCNLACSFCPGTTRRAAFLTVAQFTHLAGALRGQTRFLYFHVMGEPLLHPDLPELLDVAGRMGFRVVLTTNGTLLPKRQRELLAAQALHKVSVSLHSFEANSGVDMEHYLAGCTDFGLAASEAGILIDYRLWNLDGAETRGRNEQNDAILNHLHAAYPGNWTQNTWGWRLCDGRLSTTAKNSTGPAPMRPTTAKPGHAARCAISWPCSATGRSSPAASTARGASRSGTCWRSRSTKFLPLNLPAALPQASRCKNGSTRSAAAAAMRSAFDESVERTVKRLPCVRGGVLHHWIRASSLRR